MADLREVSEVREDDRASEEGDPQEEEMTKDVFLAKHPLSGLLVHTTGHNKEAVWAELYSRVKCGAELTSKQLAAMDEYARDHKKAQEFLKALGYEIIPAKLKYE